MNRLPLLALSVLVASLPARGDPVAEACRLLSNQKVAQAFPGARPFLCEGKKVDCAALAEEDCQASIACAARKGSSSGPNCSPCTPDWVFQRCEAAEKADVAALVLEFDKCQAKKGQWVKNPSSPLGHCMLPTGSVRGQVVNGSVDMSVFFDGKEVPNLINGGAFSIALDANTPTRIKVVDNRSKKSLEQTATVKPREQLRLVFTF